MKKITVAMFCLMVAIVACAQYTSPGFYRVHNVYSRDYISIKGTHYERSTKADAFWSCILMQGDSAQISDPGSIIYIPRLNQTSLYAQGVSTYSLTGLLMEVDTATTLEEGRKSYIATTEVDFETYSLTFFFRDTGFGLTSGTKEKQDCHWWIEPVNKESMDTSYLGLKPVSGEFTDADGYYWASMCVDYPVLLPIDGGIEGAYTVKEVKMGIDSLYYAAPVKVYGQGDIVPAATPVLFKCKAAYASGNKLVPVGEIANNTSFPLVSDMLMGNYFSTFENHCDLKDITKTAVYVPEQATPASSDKLALGVDEEGRLGFYPQEDGTYMVANTAWLSMAGMDSDSMVTVLLGEAPVATDDPDTPDNPVIPVKRGDANGDGIVSIQDVTMIIDYLMSMVNTQETLMANGDDTSDDAGDNVINLEAADVNGDGMITINDVTVLIDMLLDEANEPQDPEDPTEE